MLNPSLTYFEKLTLNFSQSAGYITDKRGYYISESTVYRILKAHDLVTSPLYTVISAHEKFPQPTKAVNELWQTDFTFFKVVYWGWYYLSTVLDDYSRLPWHGGCVRGCRQRIMARATFQKP